MLPLVHALPFPIRGTSGHPHVYEMFGQLRLRGDDAMLCDAAAVKVPHLQATQLSGENPSLSYTHVALAAEELLVGKHECTSRLRGDICSCRILHR